jgi:hypothetical protein
MTPALTPEEIYDIARPLTQPAAQLRYLRRIGIRAERRPDGSPLVLRAWLSAPSEKGVRSRPTLASDRKGNHHGQTA